VLYTLLKALLKHALHVFFRRLDVEGAEQVPTRGPLLLAANHPNTLVDVLLVASAIERKVGFVAKATLFSGITGWLFRHLGALPVARKIDGPVDEAAQRKNAEVMERCEGGIAAGQAILIFPEGVSQDDPRLMKLKTGLARIALGAAARSDQPVAIVPVALTYDDPGIFRSRARVSFGAPLDVSPYLELQRDLEAKGEDGFRAARSLTEAVRQGLLEDAVHVEETEHDALLRELDRLYGSQLEADAGGRLAATAALSKALNDFASREPERVAEVEAQVGEYRAALDAAGVEDYALRVREATPKPELVEDLAYVLSAPVAWWGILNHAIYYQIPRLTVRLIGADRLYASTIKILGGLLALAGCYAAQTLGVWQLAGQTAALVYLGTLPLSGMIALLWMEGFFSRRRVKQAARTVRRLDPQLVGELAERRQRLIRALDQARAIYLTRVLAEDPAAE
jgi:1-acyl-sn-glycerol-3-phosphate acyltransferase